jgi:hypothetical protein
MTERNEDMEHYTIWSFMVRTLNQIIRLSKEGRWGSQGRACVSYVRGQEKCRNQTENLKAISNGKT